MKKRFHKICQLAFFIILSFKVIAQSDSRFIDSLKNVLLIEKEDTNKVNTLNELSTAFWENDSDAIRIQYANEALRLSYKIDYKKGQANSSLILASAYGENGSAINAIRYALHALDIYDHLKDYAGIASAHLILQANYREVEDYDKALMHEFSGEQTAESKKVKGVFDFPGHRLAPLFLAEIGQTYILKNQLDPALIYVQRSIDQNELFNGTKWAFPIYLLATIQQMKGNYVSALTNYRSATELTIKNKNPNDTLQIYSGMSTLFRKMAQEDSAIHYAQIVIRSWNHESEIKNLLEAVTNLADVYKSKKEKDSAIRYIELSHALKDSMLGKKADREIQGIAFDQQLQQEKLATEQAKYKSRIQLYGTLAGLFFLLLVTTILWKNYKQQQNAKRKIEHAYSELKATQAQLIQSEKMASLGELTAGIAHEIQNPLNFVNNFSEVNAELIQEINNENDVAEIKVIANDIKQNNEKIAFHGKRADSIVKSMLQHSGTSKGEKQPTDINTLCDEYLRLSYHGMRAKDKTFNAAIKTDFDSSIGKVSIVPQDIGRVLLNLFNNAFYAVHEKLKKLGEGYQSTVTVSTKTVHDKIEIHVQDNGMGISKSLVDKIFQPFFTTKPTGQGTGLGLSLSYDIIKAHGGELKAESEEGQYTAFTVQLPLI